MEDVIEVRKQNFFESEKDMFPLLIVFNPPYDERISINDDDFYKKMVILSNSITLIHWPG
jgi:putative N6-adenine-specific DNA methylase